jgi:hypothetical protein
MDHYRATQSAYVCTPTNYFDDLTVLQTFLKSYKQLGGKVPTNVELAMELAESGKNMEDSLNIACDGIFKFYLEAETKCARKAGFSSLEELSTKGGERWQERDQIYDPCIAAVVRQWQLTNIDYSINPFNPESALRQFLEKSAGEVGSVVSKYIKKTALKKNNPQTVKLP